MENSFEKKIIRLVKKYAVVMIICIAVCAIVMAKVEGSKASTSYKAKITVAITSVNGYQNSTLDDIKKNQDAAAKYAGLDDKGRESLNSRVAVDVAKEGQFVDIYVTGVNEEETLKLADAEAKAFLEVGKEIRGEDMLKVISMPRKPLEAESVSKKGYYVTGGVAGLFVGIIVSAFLEVRRKKLDK